LQPYIRRNDELKNVRRGLALISTLNNVDKHRTLHVISQTVGLTTIKTFPPEYGFERTTYHGMPLEENAVVERWTFTKPPPDVNVHPGIFQQVLLADAPRPTSLVEVSFLLEGLVNVTKTVLERFAKYFPAHP
jgi:hypothetical protein